MTKCSYVILQRPFVLEIRTTYTKPKFSAVFLVCSPVTPHSKGLSTPTTHEGLGAMLALVVSLKSAKVFQRFCTGMIDIVPASFGTAVTWEPQHCCGLCTSQRFWASSILRSMPPHMHLRRKRKLELLHKVHISGSKIACKLSMIKLG